MNNINQIGYGKVPPISGQPPGNGISKVPETAPVSRGEDQVQISEVAQYLNKVASLPDIRTEKVLEIKDQLDKGTYDIEGKLSIAMDRFLEENIP